MEGNTVTAGGGPSTASLQPPWRARGVRQALPPVPLAKRTSRDLLERRGWGQGLRELRGTEEAAWVGGCHFSRISMEGVA